MADLEFRTATTDDLSRITDILRRNDLPFEDVGAHLDNFYIATHNDLLAAVGGLEFYGRHALLRSIAVTEQFRGRGIGHSMTHKLVDIARGSGADTLFLLTMTARDFFAAMGWEVVDREEVPGVIKATTEFSRLCPDTATCMRLEVQAG